MSARRLLSCEGGHNSTLSLYTPFRMLRPREKTATSPSGVAVFLCDGLEYGVKDDGTEPEVV